MELQHLLDARPGPEAQVLGVSIDTHEQTQDLLKDLGKRPNGAPSTAFPLLEDQGHRVIDRYGILNPEGRGWPHPATYVIDKAGIVQWRFVETDYRVRPPNDAILDVLKSLR